MIKRLFYSLMVILVASFIAFVLIRFVPGNPAEMMLGDTATPEQIRDMEIALGLDKPVPVQFFIFLSNLFRGDLGTSIQFALPCWELLKARLPATLLLTVCASAISIGIAIPIGIAASINRGSVLDFFSILFVLIGNSCSPVWLGILLILFFAVKLKWLPTQGYGEFKNVIMPAITMGWGMSASITRQLRSGMFDVLEEDYITATYARGVSKSEVYSKYALKNAMLPVVTVIGSQIAIMLAGSVVTEAVFGWPGVGSLMIKAISNRDYPMVQASLLVSSIIYVVVNMIVDIIYTFLDPRLKLN